MPLDLKPLYVTSVSAQVGRNQLEAGLIAAAIGLLLVVVYSFLYYRGLGIVSVSSLAIAALITFLAVVLLSKYQNFKLELSGIAGLIVAIGITADSFVVYFERLRDEVREGKQLRPAVESGWKRARRTILVSDTVSFLAALLLYYFAIGEVKGFAYTLGLTTLIDIVVVFLFTKPMVTILAGTKFFGDGHPMSGLDPARLGAKTPWRSSVRRNPVRRRPDPATRSTGVSKHGGFMMSRPGSDRRQALPRRGIDQLRRQAAPVVRDFRVDPGHQHRGAAGPRPGLQRRVQGRGGLHLPRPFRVAQPGAEHRQRRRRQRRDRAAGSRPDERLAGSDQGADRSRRPSISRTRCPASSA